MSFGVGIVNVIPIRKRGYVSASEMDAAKAIQDKAKELSEYLESRGLNVDVVNLSTTQTGIARHSVDVVLNDKVLAFGIGEKSNTIANGGINLSRV